MFVHASIVSVDVYARPCVCWRGDACVSGFFRWFVTMPGFRRLDKKIVITP